ncbi:hypothetical protein [Brachybacterium fresconis]|uniref:H-NS histone family protein n=1 Tax=Brachybacterium fresconis TaxID=173363 RepID=A0ABS4YHK1_9MICO|nr:hypothetical protein [Brachybacterium fresconis]MBP2408273.1 hypothetical protein [Brachybacterium fresconis]
MSTNTTQNPQDAAQDHETPEDAQDAAEAPETDQEATEETQESPNKEAARYRVKLRETETERDQLSTELATAQATIDQLRTRHLEDALGATQLAALRYHEVSTDDVLREDWTVDPDAVKRVKDQGKRRGVIWRPTGAAYKPNAGTGGADTGQPVSWADAARGNRAN